MAEMQIFCCFYFVPFRVQSLFFRRDLIRIRSEECSSTAHKSRWNGERLKQWAKWNSAEWKMRPLENWININLPVAPLRLPSFSMPHPPVIMNYLARHLSNDLAQLFFFSPSFLFNQFFGWRQSDPLRPDIRCLHRNCHLRLRSRRQAHGMVNGFELPIETLKAERKYKILHVEIKQTKERWIHKFSGEILTSKVKFKYFFLRKKRVYAKPTEMMKIFILH